MNAANTQLEFLKRPGSNKAKAVIIMHGYGADQSDLYPLADLLDPKKQWNWYFPNGVLQAIIGPGMFGRAWFQVNMEKWEQNIREGKTSDMSGSRPGNMDNAIQAIVKFYEKIQAEHQDVVLGGFSQGSMLATEVALRCEPAPKGLVIWSGTLVDKKTLTGLLQKRHELPFVQSHGVNDVILGFQYAQNLHKSLSDAGMSGEFIPFQGGHEIPMNVLQATQSFLRSVL